MVTSDGNGDVRRQRHVAVDDDIPKLVQHQRQVFSVRRAELYDEVRVVDLRRLPGYCFNPFQCSACLNRLYAYGEMTSHICGHFVGQHRRTVCS